MTTSCVVYWLRDEQCICPWRHGYIGISTNHRHRISNHRGNRSFPKFTFQILFVGSPAECRVLEYKLRPGPKIGWNRGAGGGKPRFGIPDTVTALQNKSAARRRFLSKPEASEILRAAYAKSSATQKGKTIPWADKIAKTLTGHIRTSASRAKQSAKLKGKPKSAEWREKMRQAALARYRDPAEHERTSRAVKEGLRRRSRSQSQLDFFP